MALYYFIILPHWAGYFGWVGMGIYIGLYLPVFVALSRVAVHRLRVPLLIAAPVVWVGLEVLRGILITGFSMALLGHTQVSWTTLIQAADLFGAYTISFALMFATACVAMIFPVVRERFRLWPAIPIVAMIVAMVLYGNHRLNEQHVIRSRTVRVALIQGSIDTQFDLDQTEAYEREKRLWKQYQNLTINARKAKEKPDLDLIIWPESKFRIPDRIYKVDCPPWLGV